MEFCAKNFDELTSREVYEILRVRSQIFIVEQKMNCQDMDGVDFYARHYFLEENGKIAAYMRAYYADDNKSTVKIGRVLTLIHGKGWGRELFERSVNDIKEHFNVNKIRINSQKHAVGFYEKLGFKTVSGEFLEEGVVHVSMTIDI